MSSFVLKIIACIFMLIDHIGMIFLPSSSILRILGRLAFPIFAFQISIGYKNTHDKSKYLKKMFIFALISQFPYTLARLVAGYNGFSLNIGFSFFISLFALFCVDKFKETHNILYIIAIASLLAIGQISSCDYGLYGISTVILFYIFRDKKYFPYLIFSYFTLNVLCLILNYVSFNQIWSIIALFIICFYNGKKGYNFKYLFYVFYPLHFLILYFIKLLL